MATLENVLATIDANQGAALDRLFALVSIPSISAIPGHFPDCEQAADWLVAQLQEIGFEARKAPTKGRPMVVGSAKGKNRDAPHVLFYGHYDVQPADPLERRAHRRARRRRRQGPVDDLPRGLPRLTRRRRPALPR